MEPQEQYFPTSFPMATLLLRGVLQVTQAACPPQQLQWDRLAPHLIPTQGAPTEAGGALSEHKQYGGLLQKHQDTKQLCEDRAMSLWSPPSVAWPCSQHLDTAQQFPL